MKKLLFILCLFSFSSQIFAQQIWTRVHVVKKGESLESIVKSYLDEKKVKTRRINVDGIVNLQKRVNYKLNNFDKLKVGSLLYLELPLNIPPKYVLKDKYLASQKAGDPVEYGESIGGKYYVLSSNIDYTHELENVKGSNFNLTKLKNNPKIMEIKPQGHSFSKKIYVILDKELTVDGRGGGSGGKRELFGYKIPKHIGLNVGANILTKADIDQTGSNKLETVRNNSFNIWVDVNYLHREDWNIDFEGNMSVNIKPANLPVTNEIFFHEKARFLDYSLWRINPLLASSFEMSSYLFTADGNAASIAKDTDVFVGAGAGLYFHIQGRLTKFDTLFEQSVYGDSTSVNKPSKARLNFYAETHLKHNLILKLNFATTTGSGYESSRYYIGGGYKF